MCTHGEDGRIDRHTERCANILHFSGRKGKSEILHTCEWSRKRNDAFPALLFAQKHKRRRFAQKLTEEKTKREKIGKNTYFCTYWSMLPGPENSSRRHLPTFPIILFLLACRKCWCGEDAV
jgi:hypothetical protein